MDRGNAVAVFGDDIIFIVVGSGFTGAVEEYGAVGGIVHVGIGAVESVVDIGEMVFIADQFLIDGNLFIHIDFHAVFIFGNAIGEGNAVAGLEDIVAVIDIFPAGEYITGNRRGFSGGNDGVFIDMTIEVMENAAVLAAFEYHQFIGIDALHIFGNQGVFTVDHIFYDVFFNTAHVNAEGSFGFFPADEFIIFAGGNGELYGFAVDEVAVIIFRHGVGGVIGVVSEGIFDLFIDSGELDIIGDTHSLAGLIDGALVVLPTDETLAVFGGGSVGQSVCSVIGNALLIQQRAVGIFHLNVILNGSGIDIHRHSRRGHGESIGAVSGGSTGNTVRLAVFDVSSVNAGKFMTGVGRCGHRHFRTNSGSTRQSRSSRVCSGRGNRKLLRRPFGGVGLAVIGLIIGVGGDGDGGTVTIPAAEGIAFFGGSGGHGQRRAFGAVEHIENSAVNIFKGDENIVGHRFFINEDRCDHGLAGNVIVKGCFQNNISVIFFLYGPPDEFFARGNRSVIADGLRVVIGNIAGGARDGFQCLIFKSKRIDTGFFQRESFRLIHSGQSVIPVRNTRLQI